MGPCVRRDDNEIVVATRQRWSPRRMTDSFTGQSIETARRILAARFKSGALESSELDARILVGHLLDLDLTGMIAAAARPITAHEAARLEEMTQRRLAGEP